MKIAINSIRLTATLMLVSFSSYAASITSASPIGYWQTINKDTNRPSSIIKIYAAKSKVAGKTVNVINGKIFAKYVSEASLPR